MRLTLQNGYPYPLPPGFDFDAHNPHVHFVGFDGVRHFEWLHTLTIEFDTQEGARQAIESSGGAWTWWAEDINAVEAQTSAEDGYGHPAIIYNGMAYCGFILRDES